MAHYGCNRYGGGNYYEDPYQAGAGIGSVFSKLFSNVVPIVKSIFNVGKQAAATPLGQAVIRDAKKTAMQAGLNVVNDAMEGKNILQSTRDQVKGATRTMTEQLKRRAEMAMSNPHISDNIYKSRSPRRRSGPPRATATSAANLNRRRRRGGGGSKRKKKDGRKRRKIDMFDI